MQLSQQQQLLRHDGGGSVWSHSRACRPVGRRSPAHVASQRPPLPRGACSTAAWDADEPLASSQQPFFWQQQQPQPLPPQPQWTSLPLPPLPTAASPPADSTTAAAAAAAATTSSSSSDAADAGAGDPAATLRRVLEVVRDGDLDGMLEFCPDEVIDRLLAWRKATGAVHEPLHFEDILKTNSAELLYLDTYALRNLIMTAPKSVRVLSAVRAAAQRYVQRCAIVAPSGEECVLTFNVELQETAEGQYRGPPLLSSKWMLRGVTGECSSDELPSHPSPSFPPEAVVEAQLAALREGRVACWFAHASPENKAATGPAERFRQLLQTHPTYAPLLGHARAETVQRLQPCESTYMEVVRVTPAPGRGAGAAAPAGSSSSSSSSSSSAVDGATSQQQQQQQGEEAEAEAEAEAAAQEPLLYMWIVSRQGGSSAWANCWMADAVQLVSFVPTTAAPSA